MVYQFKSATRVPAGVTADGVMAEKERIGREYGKATVRNATAAVLSAPDRYPNLRAFGPRNAEEAFEQSIAEGIQYAWRNVVEVRVTVLPSGEQQRREVRVVHQVTDSEGDRIYAPLVTIAGNDSMRRELLASLQKDVDAFSNKLKDVIAEIQEIA